MGPWHNALYFPAPIRGLERDYVRPHLGCAKYHAEKLGTHLADFEERICFAEVMAWYNPRQSVTLTRSSADSCTRYLST